MRVTAKKDKEKNNNAVDAEQLAEREREEAEAEEKSARLNAAINEHFSGLIEQYTPKPRRKGMKIFLIILRVLLILAAAAGIFLWVRHSRENEQYKTGLTDGGELCIACRAEDGEFTLSEEGIITESARFAFDEFGGRKLGRIYTPVSEGEVTVSVKYYPSGSTEPVRERFDVTVDSELKITYTSETITEGDKTKENDSNEESS